MRLALLALAALVWIAVPVSARAGNSRYLGWHSGSFYRR